MPCGENNNGQDGPVEIRIEDLHKAFNDRPVLKGVELDVMEGDILAIVGGSGEGKTVLLDHMVGLLTPDSGRVLVAVDRKQPGTPMADLAKLSPEEFDEVRKRWALVFQKNALLSGTVFKNLALWLREHTDLGPGEIYERAREALDAVGFAGDESIMNKRRSELSGGMAKRVAVARAIAMKPEILFYDEPTTGLDPYNASKIHELICATHSKARQAGDAQTTVIITHDKDLLHRLRPRIVMLSEGKVFFDGPYNDFEKSDSEIIRPYFELMPVFHRMQAAKA